MMCCAGVLLSTCDSLYFVVVDLGGTGEWSSIGVLMMVVLGVVFPVTKVCVVCVRVLCWGGIAFAAL